MSVEAILVRNLSQYRRWAELAHKEGDLNTAVTLYYKALVAISDIVVYRKAGLVPSNHAERFRLLQREFPELYEVLDRDFAFYRDSYHLEVRREVAEAVRDDVDRLARDLRIG